jgi:phosphoenolpyruvate carboxykinase (GTP)
MATAPDRSAAPQHAPENLRHWVLEVAARTRPDQIHWCDGSEAEYRELLRGMIATGDLRKLKPELFPGRILRTSRASNT